MSQVTNINGLRLYVQLTSFKNFTLASLRGKHLAMQEIFFVSPSTLAVTATAFISHAKLSPLLEPPVNPKNIHYIDPPTFVEIVIFCLPVTLNSSTSTCASFLLNSFAIAFFRTSSVKRCCSSIVIFVMERNGKATWPQLRKYKFSWQIFVRDMCS